MKTKAEIQMEWTQAEVRRLKRELDEAIKAADKAWSDYVNEGPIKPVSESSNAALSQAAITRKGSTCQMTLNRQAIPLWLQ